MMLRPFVVIVALLAANASAWAQGTAKPKATLNSEVTQQIPDNTTGLIQPSNARTVYNDIIASTQSYAGVNAQVSASYTIVTSDYGQLVTFTNSNPVAVTIPGAGSAGFNPFSVFLKNLGTGLVTVTPSIGTIAGAASVQMTQNQGLFIVSDGTNWQTWFGSGGGGITLPVTVPNGGTGQTTLTNHGVLVGAGTSAITQLAAASLGTVLAGQGVGSDPAFSSSPMIGALGIGGVAAATGTTLYNAPVAPGANGQGALGASGANGFVAMGQGSSNDVTVENKTGQVVCSAATGTQTWACNTLTLINALAIAQGGSGATTASAAFGNLAPTPTRAGDIIYWNGSSWVTLPGNNAGTLVLQENASGVPSWASVAGTGTVTNVVITGATGVSVSGVCNITTSGTCTVKQSLANATLQASPANPTGTANTVSFTMAGLGSTCTLTPSYSTRVLVYFGGFASNSVLNDGVEARIQYGSGAAPTNGATSAGTPVGPTVGITAVPIANASMSFATTAIVTGLTAGTAYWFDLAQIAVGGGTGSLLALACSLMEF
jgi:hypothetical protein